MPLVARDEVIGLVEISETREGRTIAPEQIATVTAVCRLIAMALHDADTMHAQEARARRLASLFESSRAVAGAATMEEALAVVARCAGEVFGVSECVAYEHDPDLDAVVARAMWERTPSGWDRLGEPSLLAEDPMSRGVLESGQPFLGLLSDPRLDPVSRADLETWGEQSCLTVPMQSVDGPMGLLNLWDKEQERAYTEGEMALAISLAELAGEAVRNAKLLRRLRGLSESDSLTGLANHRKLHEVLAHEQARAERYGSHFSLVMLDIDEFKLLNDTHGHPAGDAVLRQVGTLLSEQTRAADVVGRYGGDEFLLVLPETSADEAGLLAEKLRAALREEPYVTAAGEQIPIHASFGIAAYPEDVPDANGLVALADANLYASKRRGGDAVTGSEEERSLRDVEGGTFGLFESLVTAVDNKDRYTRRHSEEVTEYALAISRELGLSDESQRVLRVAALLHDVGKIGVPDRILRKPGRLTEAEYEVVKGHSLLGETIIAAIPDVERDPRRRRLTPRALRRQRLSARPGQGGDPPARAHHGRGRHLLGDDDRPSLPEGAHPRRGDQRAAHLLGDAVRSPDRRDVHRLHGTGRGVRGRGAERTVRRGRPGAGRDRDRGAGRDRGRGPRERARRRRPSLGPSPRRR